MVILEVRRGWSPFFITESIMRYGVVVVQVGEVVVVLMTRVMRRRVMAVVVVVMYSTR